MPRNIKDMSRLNVCARHLKVLPEGIPVIMKTAGIGI